MNGVTVYDNGGRSFDRYTAIFSDTPDGSEYALGIGDTGNVPNGFCMTVDYVEGEHLGVIVPVESLPAPVQAAIAGELASIESFAS